VLILKQELAETNSLKNSLETDIEKLQRKMAHLKEQTIKEVEKKYINEIKELHYIIHLLTTSKDNITNKQLGEDQCLQDENYRLTQEVQYLEFKLKVGVLIIGRL